MADDNNQRTFRADDAASRTSSSGNDPLAELARLIGQNDPFAEYGRNNGGRPADPNAGWPETATYPASQASPEPEPPYAGNGYGRQSFGSPSLSTDAPGLYEVDAHAPGYATRGYEQDGYAGQQAAYDNAFPPSQEPLHDVHQQFGQNQFGPAPSDEYYDDVPPSRRRISVLAIAGVIGLAVLGTAGALGYRAVFGPSAAPATPPVIRADATPSKVVPAPANKEPGKATDRVGANGQVEQLVSRQEQPVPVATTPNQPVTNSAFPPPANANAPAMGSGVVGEARKIRTIVIRPDQPIEGVPTAAMDVPPPTASPTPVRVVNAGPAEPPRPPAPAPRQVAAPMPVQAPPAAAPVPQPQAAAPAPSNAPLSLNPNAAPARPARVASAPAAAPVAAPTSGGYAVQVSSQRSEGEAQTAFSSLQGKFPSQLGGRQATIRRADLGEKGIYYRAMVVVGSSAEATELCTSLKAAGGSCIVQRN